MLHNWHATEILFLRSNLGNLLQSAYTCKPYNLEEGMCSYLIGDCCEQVFLACLDRSRRMLGLTAPSMPRKDFWRGHSLDALRALEAQARGCTENHQAQTQAQIPKPARTTEIKRSSSKNNMKQNTGNQVVNF